MIEGANSTSLQSPRDSEDVDSAATTFVASPGASKLHSFDESWRRKDTELSREGEWHDGKKLEGLYHDDESSSNHGRRESVDSAESSLVDDSAPLVREPSAGDAIGEDEAPPPPPEVEKDKPVSWADLPRKSQLVILTLARLSEPLAQTSLQSYMFYQLKSFKLPDGSSPSDDTVARQAGILAAAFTGAQFMTAIMWGRLADWDRMGRKRVILIGLLGTAIGALGIGFSQSFPTAVFWRVVAGLLNGNIGVMRTMISEIIKEKKYQSRAFLLLPMTFNVGVIIGPLIGGLLAQPAESYPGIFGPEGPLGAWWLREWPYALPNVVNATFLVTSATALALGMEETLESLRNRPDYGLRFSRWVGRNVFRIKPEQKYISVTEQEIDDPDVESNGHVNRNTASKPRQKLPFRRIWTANVLFTLLSHGLMTCHVGTFNNLWFVFLSTPRYDPNTSEPSSRLVERLAIPSEPVRTPENYHPHLPFVFTGGLALPPSSIGTALAILGVIGITLQLLLYPVLSFRLGTIRSFRCALLLFPLTYVLSPFLAVLPSSRPPPEQASGFFVWAGIALVLLVQVTARTFALPASAILVNNSSPHPSVLGTVHGIAQSVSSATRTAGPIIGGYLYGVGLQKGMVGIGWWSVAIITVLGAIAGQFVWEGDGHEILLEGEQKD